MTHFPANNGIHFQWFYLKKPQTNLKIMKTYTLTDWLCVIGCIGQTVPCWWFRMNDPALTGGNRSEKSLNVFRRRNWDFRHEKDLKIFLFPLKRTWFGNYFQFKISSIPCEGWKGNSYHISTRTFWFFPALLITMIWKMLSVPAWHASLPKPYSCKRSMHTSITNWHTMARTRPQEELTF